MPAPVQGSSKTIKPPNDDYFGLTKSQVKLLLLGTLFTDDDGKVRSTKRNPILPLAISG